MNEHHLSARLERGLGRVPQGSSPTGVHSWWMWCEMLLRVSAECHKRKRRQQMSPEEKTWKKTSNIHSALGSRFKKPSNPQGQSAPLWFTGHFKPISRTSPILLLYIAMGPFHHLCWTCWSLLILFQMVCLLSHRQNPYTEPPVFKSQFLWCHKSNTFKYISLHL